MLSYYSSIAVACKYYTVQAKSITGTVTAK